MSRYQYIAIREEQSKKVMDFMKHENKKTHVPHVDIATKIMEKGIEHYHEQ